MIIKVKKSSFWIYTISLIVGAIFIIVGSILSCYNCPKWIETILVSVGCSTIPTVAVAYLIERAAEIRDSEKKKELRDTFLWGMPRGLLSICKVIIEEFYTEGDVKNKSFKLCFDTAACYMESLDSNSENYQQYAEKCNDLMKKLDYGISLCLRDCKAILERQFILQINSIFSKEELLTISYLFDECNRIKNSFVICETAEYIRVLVNEIYDNIPEVKTKLDRNIVFERGLIRNWAELSK